MKLKRVYLILFSLAFILVACSDDIVDATDDEEPEPVLYSVSGTVMGDDE